MGGIDPSGESGENGEKRRYLLLAYVIVVIVRRHILLVQVAIGRHCIPGPSGSSVILFIRFQSSLEPVLYTMKSEWV